MYYIDVETGSVDYAVINSMDEVDSYHTDSFNIWDYL